MVQEKAAGWHLSCQICQTRHKKVQTRCYWSGCGGFSFKASKHEWQFIQCIVPNIGEKFEAVKVSLHKHFLSALFKESLEEDDPHLSLAGLPVKKAGLALPNLVATANSNYKASSIVCGHLTQAICGKHEFSSANHSTTMQEVKSKLKECSNADHNKELELITKKISCDEHRAILCSKLTGAIVFYSITVDHHQIFQPIVIAATRNLVSNMCSNARKVVLSFHATMRSMMKSVI
jgi:hypothetical protein